MVVTKYPIGLPKNIKYLAFPKPLGGDVGFGGEYGFILSVMGQELEKCVEWNSFPHLVGYVPRGYQLLGGGGINGVWGSV